MGTATIVTVALSIVPVPVQVHSAPAGSFVTRIRICRRTTKDVTAVAARRVRLAHVDQRIERTNPL